LEALVGDVPAFTDVLLYHVVPSEVIVADVITLGPADTVLGQSVTIFQYIKSRGVKFDETTEYIFDD
jgi:uncharacterized surface protein with fasciclin (FAS1) repeats